MTVKHDQLKPYTTELFQVRTSVNGSVWSRNADFDTEAEALAYVADRKADDRKMKTFVDFGKVRWIVQRRTHTVHEVKEVL